MVLEGFKKRIKEEKIDKMIGTNNA